MTTSKLRGKNKQKQKNENTTIKLMNQKNQNPK